MEQKNTPPNAPKIFKSKVLPVVLSVAGLLVVLAIIGIGALLAGHVWNPGWNPFKQNSNTDNIIRQKTKAFIEK